MSQFEDPPLLALESGESARRPQSYEAVLVAERAQDARNSERIPNCPQRGRRAQADEPDRVLDKLAKYTGSARSPRRSQNARSRGAHVRAGICRQDGYVGGHSRTGDGRQCSREQRPNGLRPFEGLPQKFIGGLVIAGQQSRLDHRNRAGERLSQAGHQGRARLRCSDSRQRPHRLKHHIGVSFTQGFGNHRRRFHGPHPAERLNGGLPLPTAPLSGQMLTAIEHAARAEEFVERMTLGGVRDIPPVQSDLLDGPPHQRTRLPRRRGNDACQDVVPIRPDPHRALIPPPQIPAADHAAQKDKRQHCENRDGAGRCDEVESGYVSEFRTGMRMHSRTPRPNGHLRFADNARPGAPGGRPRPLP